MTRALRIEAFLAWLRDIKRVSPRTSLAYREDLTRLCGFLDQLPAPPADWASLRAETLRGFVAESFRGGLSGRSLARRLSAVRSFYRWLMREGLAKSNPAQGLRAPKSPRKLPNVLDADEMKSLLDEPAEGRESVRDQAMFELLYSSALRVSELCGLRWMDLDFSENLVRVDGKGGRQRVVPFGTPAREALMQLRNEGVAMDAPVFQGRAGAAISVRSVQTRLKRHAERAGIWKRVHPHLMRHSCASHLLESSGNLRAVQEMLGHADIATTQIYTHLDFQHLARVYDQAHPRARRR